MLLLLTLAFSANAFAAAAAADGNCYINEDTVLTQDWVFHCDGDVVIGENVKIITHEHKFSPQTSHSVKYGTVQKPAQIRCLDENDSYDLGTKTCGKIYVEATELDGGLRLDCSAPGSSSCSVGIATAGYTSGYHQTLKTGFGGSAKFWNGNAEANPTVRWIN